MTHIACILNVSMFFKGTIALYTSDFLAQPKLLHEWVALVFEEHFELSFLSY